MSHSSIIDLYTELANNPDKDFGWDKGLQNARNHGYRDEWINCIPEQVWTYCAAVGNPFEAGKIKKGETVLDIGCGAGVDLCVASLLVGENGKVLGVDLTPSMVIKARENVSASGFSNITVYESTIEKLPIENNGVNVVISNGAINLSSEKEAVFSEIYRVLVNGGHLCISDMIKDENYIDSDSCKDESWADCVAGTLKNSELIQLMENAGFIDAKQSSTNHYKTSPSTIGSTFTARKA